MTTPVVRAHSNSAVRRVLLAGVGLLAPFLVAAGLAWGCTPNASLTIDTDQGLPGHAVGVRGAGFWSDAQVKLRWNSVEGPVLATANGPDFSAAITIPDAAPGVYTIVAVAYASNGAPTATAQRPFEVARAPSLSLEPSLGPPLTRTIVSGDRFAYGPVELRWDSAQGPLLAASTGPSFSTAVTIPAGAGGRHQILAVGRDEAGRLYGPATAAFEVTGPGPVPPPGRSSAGSPAPVGPAISRAALARANGTRTVSRNGYVRLFCGRFKEEDVTGRCGARSARRLPAGRPSRPLRASKRRSGRSVVLRLPPRFFEAEQGRSVWVRFRLERKSLKLLERAGKVRMRGHVVATDFLRKRSRATFGFVLKASDTAGESSARASGSPAW